MVSFQQKFDDLGGNAGGVYLDSWNPLLAMIVVTGCSFVKDVKGAFQE